MKSKLLLQFTKILRETSTPYEWSNDEIIIHNLRILSSVVYQFSNPVSYITIYPIDGHFYTGYKQVSYSFPCNNLETLNKKLSLYMQKFSYTKLPLYATQKTRSNLHRTKQKQHGSIQVVNKYCA